MKKTPHKYKVIYPTIIDPYYTSYVFIKDDNGETYYQHISYDEESRDMIFSMLRTLVRAKHELIKNINLVRQRKE